VAGAQRSASARKSLKRAAVFQGRQVARRLLGMGVGRFILTRLALSSLIVYAVGCVIPTPLEAETTPTIGQPVITVGESPGDFGPVSISPISSGFTFQFAAVDNVVDDQLFGMVFKVDGDVDRGNYLSLYGLSGTPMEPVPNDPKTRTMTTNANSYCCFLSGGNCNVPSTDVTVYAFASTDQNPTLSNLGPPMFKGPSSRNHWTVSCH
jgi:hypothetical protein